MASEPEMSIKDVQGILVRDHGLVRDRSVIGRHMRKAHQPFKPYRLQKLSPLHSKQRLAFCKTVLRRHLKHQGVRVRSFGKGGEVEPLDIRKAVWVDKKLFTVKKTCCQSTQNRRVWFKKGLKKKEAAVLLPSKMIQEKRTGSHGVMMGLLLAGDGRVSRPAVMPSGLKINSEVYQKILEQEYYPQILEWYPDHSFVWIQDNTPSHGSKSTVEWLSRNWVANGAEILRWPPCSPDLHPLDFSIWSILESKLPIYPNTAAGRALLQSTVNARAMALDPVMVHKVCNEEFLRRIRACIRAGGGHFEHLLK